MEVGRETKKYVCDGIAELVKLRSLRLGKLLGCAILKCDFTISYVQH
jgi:hypothetical protein